VRAIVVGVGYGLQYILALATSNSCELAGIVSRGSEKSCILAKYLEVPLYTRIDDIPSDVNYACVAVRDGAWGSKVAADLLRRGLHVIIEHPITPEYLTPLIEIANRKGLVLNVNSHFSDMPAPIKFTMAMAQLRQHCSIDLISGITSRRTLYAMFDLLGRCVGATPELEFLCKAPLPQEHVPPERFAFVKGTCCGLEISLQIDRFLSSDDDGSDQLIGGHLICVSQEGTLGIVSHSGPVYWLRSFGSINSELDVSINEMIRREVGEEIGAVDWNATRIKTNLYALSRFEAQIATAIIPTEQTASFLLGVSKSWDCVERAISGSRP
jgi:pyochelin biosynthesis protein PchG